MKLAVQAVALDRERAVLRDEVFQCNGLDALKQVLKALGLEGCQQDHDPLAHAAAEVGLRHIRKAPVKKYAPVLYPDVPEIEPLELVSDQTFQSKQARHTVSQIFHIFGTP